MAKMEEKIELKISHNSLQKKKSKIVGKFKKKCNTKFKIEKKIGIVQEFEKWCQIEDRTKIPKMAQNS